MEFRNAVRGVALFNDSRYEKIPLLQIKGIERRVAEQEDVPVFIFNAEWLKEWEGYIPHKERVDSLPISVTRNGEKINSLKGYELLAFSFSGFGLRMLSEIERLGGINHINQDGINRCLDWALYVKQQYLHRKITMTKVSELEDVVDDYLHDGQVFAKTRIKKEDGWGTLMSKNDLVTSLKNGLPYKPRGFLNLFHCGITSEDLIILSEPVEFEKENAHTREYRVWVVNNTPISLIDYNLKDFASQKLVADFAQNFCADHSQILPSCYVLDVGIVRGVGPAVVEINPLIYSGNDGSENVTSENFRRIIKKFVGNS